MKRITFLIDGFNLYHSVRQASKDLKLGGTGTKWLNIYEMCESYLPLFGKDSKLEDVFYFSAFAYHMQSIDKHTVARHKKIIKCLEATGIDVTLNEFKPKNVRCNLCKGVFKRHEEKETDVALSAKLFEVLIEKSCDAVVLMTGDTDLLPAVETATRLYPNVSIRFAFPYRRFNNLLKTRFPDSFQIKKNIYTKFQFTDPFTLPDGVDITKPKSW